MTESDREPTIKRILIALDASPHSLSALEAAAELATSLRAELLGLFVEDINLLRLAELPFAREVGHFSGTVRRVSTRHLERQLQTQAGRARQALDAIAGRAQVQWSFQVTRGQIASELQAAALDADLVILGKAGWSGQRCLGSHARTFLAHTRGSTLILQEGVGLGLPVLVLYDGSRATQSALAAGTELMRAREGHLTVFVAADGQPEARRLQAESAEWLRQRGLRASYRWLARADVPRLCHAVRAEGGGMLVLHRDTPLLRGKALQTLLDEMECAVLLVT